MLNTLYPTLYPRNHADYEALPVIGKVLNSFCVWLDRRGCPADAIRRRISATRLIASALRRRRILSLRGLTAQSLLAFAPRATDSASLRVRTSLRSLTLFLSDKATGTARRADGQTTTMTFENTPDRGWLIVE